MDESGYLKRTLEDLINELELFEHIKIDIDTAETILKKIQLFDPVGIASRDLRECLLIQLRRSKNADPYYKYLAEKMLESNGFIAGAVYSDDYTVVHIVTNNKHKLDEIRGSKYIQSYAGDLYTNVKHLLDIGEKVLVCATPCQINALYSVIGKDCSNLITCDFICRGVGSPKVFLKSMDMLEQEYGARAIKIVQKNKTVNVGQLEEIFPGKNDIDLTKEGFDKLLGGGRLNKKLKIKVNSASEKAIAKIKDKGGEIILPKISKEPTVEEEQLEEK